MPNTRSHYHRRPGRYAFEKQEFQRLIAELNRLALKKGYSQGEIASEVGVSLMTVNHWLTGHSLMAQRETHTREWMQHFRSQPKKPKERLGYPSTVTQIFGSNGARISIPEDRSFGTEGEAIESGLKRTIYGPVGRYLFISR